MTTIKADPLSRAAIEVLGQLFTHGPTWDGNVVSKAGRGELFDAGLVFRVEGFAALTEDGLRTAIDFARNQDRASRWYCKWQDLPWPREPSR